MGIIKDNSLIKKNEITFLHLSDLHICEKDLKIINQIISELFKDLDRLKLEDCTAPA